MRRAVLALLLVAALPHPSLAAEVRYPVDWIGMIDYKHGPRFTVGDWVRYDSKSDSYRGYRTDYTVTVLIAGEEMWWGEKCFWVETQTSYSGEPPEVAASLLSYGIFADTLPSLRFTRYIRKFLNETDEQGHFIQQLFRRSTSDIADRSFAEYEPPYKFDTLGVERVEVPKGAFDAMRVKRVLRQTKAAQEGDSTINYERVEDQTFSWSDQVPITRLVKIDMEDTQRRRVWMIGESDNAPLLIVERARGWTQLLDFGSGMKALSIPERFQRPLSEQRPARAKPARRPAGKRG